MIDEELVADWYDDLLRDGEEAPTGQAKERSSRAKLERKSRAKLEKKVTPQQHSRALCVFWLTSLLLAVPSEVGEGAS